MLPLGKRLLKGFPVSRKNGFDNQAHVQLLLALLIDGTDPNKPDNFFDRPA